MSARPQLPILVLLLTGLRRIAQRREALVRGLGLPTALLAGLQVASPPGVLLPSGSETNTDWTQGAQPPAGLDSFVPALLGLWLSCIFAVSACRILLLPKPALPGAFGLYWTRRELRFSLAFAALTGLSLIMSVPLASILVEALNAPDPAQWDPFTWAVFSLAYLPGAYLFGRLGLVLPSIATDRPLPLPQSWKLTKGNGARIAAGAVAPSLLIGVLFGSDPMATTLPTEPFSALALVLSHQAATLIGVATLSVAYHQLRPRSPG